jgi:hypothetical protein
VKIRREEEKEQRKTHKSARNHRSTQKRRHTYDLLLIRMNGTTAEIRATSSGVGPDQRQRRGTGEAERICQLEDGGLGGEAEGQRVEAERPGHDVDGELLVQELRGAEEGLLCGARPKLHHVAQADAHQAHRAPL